MMEFEIDWKKYPKLAVIFEHRPRVNAYWQELLALLRSVAVDTQLRAATIAAAATLAMDKKLDAARVEIELLKGVIVCDICGREAVAVFHAGEGDGPGHSCAEPDHMASFDAEPIWIQPLTDAEKAAAMRRT